MTSPIEQLASRVEAGETGSMLDVRIFAALHPEYELEERDTDRLYLWKVTGRHECIMSHMTAPAITTSPPASEPDADVVELVAHDLDEADKSGPLTNQDRAEIAVASYLYRRVHIDPAKLAEIRERHTDYDRWVSHDEPSEQAHADRAALLAMIGGGDV